MIAVMLVIAAHAMAEVVESPGETGKAIAAEKKTKLPKTGGPNAASLLPIAGLVLVGAGIVSYTVLKRR